MPLINVRTSLPALKDGSALLQELSSELANQTGKSEAYVMTLLETGVPMTFAGSHEALCLRGGEVDRCPASARDDGRILRIDPGTHWNSCQPGVHRF